MKFIKNNLLYETTEVKTSVQAAIITTCLGNAYKTALSYADGMITAKYLDYENNLVDYNGEIIFEFEGEQQSVQAVNGIATLPFEVVDAGTYVVRTVNENVDNGEVTING